MRQKLLLVLLTVMMVVSCIAGLSACDLSGLLPHSHTFSEEWSFDDTHHWHQCSCGQVEEKAEHTWDAGVETIPATCTEDRTKTYTCTVCGETKTEPIPATDHTFSDDWSFDETYHWHAATCEHSDQVSDKAEHAWDAGVETTPATCTENGTKTYTCTVCGETKTETISATGHSFSGDWTCDDTYHWHQCSCGQVEEKAEHTWDAGVETTPATCTEDGIKTYTCTVCGETKTEKIPATGHSFSEDWTCDDTYHWHQCSCGQVEEKAKHNLVNGICSICNYGPLDYSLSEDGTYYIVTGPGSSTGNITIPTTYNNLPVTSIGSSAFYGCSGLTSVTIPDSVTSIGEKAFYGCSSLASATIGNGATRIGGYAFCGCSGLTSVTIGNGVTSIGSEAFYRCAIADVYIADLAAWCAISFADVEANPLNDGANLHLDGTLVTDLVVPDTITDIKNYAFYRCSSLTSVTIPDSVTSIGEEAFYGCSSLTCVTIGSGVTSMSRCAFYECSSLTSVTISNGVTRIGEWAFGYCRSLTSVTIPDSVTSIGEEAFYGCSSLTCVTIGNSVTSIGSYAFEGCYKLIEVYNKSALSLTIGEQSNGWVAYYAKNIYTQVEGESWFTDTEDGYRFFYNGNKNVGYLLAYLGTETALELPQSFAAHNGTLVEKYEIYQYAFSDKNSLTSITLSDSVTRISDSAFYGCSGLTEIIIPDSVTSIGNSAFSGCSGLTSITIGSGVTSIGDYAFYECSGLTSVTLPDSVTSIGERAFRNCSSLTEIVIPDSVTSIGDYAFYGCDALQYTTYENAYYLGNESNPYILLVKTDSSCTSCTIHENTKFIASSAFTSSKITSIVIPDGVTSIGNDAFYNCIGLTSVTIPDSVTSIGDYAFYGCSRLTEIVIPDSVTSIGDRAFIECSRLTCVTIGSGVTSIGERAFYGCTALTQINYNAAEVADLTNTSYVFYNAGTESRGITVVFGESVKSIPAYLFFVNSSSYRPNITSVTVGSGVTSIGSYAFNGCSGLASVTIGNNVTSIGNSAFSGCDALQYTTYENAYYLGNESNPYILLVKTDSSCTSCTIHENTKFIASSAFSSSKITSIVIPDSVTSIGKWAFYNCSSLTSVTIGSGVTSIGDYAFYGCSGLTSVTIGNSVAIIGYQAFYGCSSLTEIVIPDSVTSIGEEAFYGCSSLTSVTIGSGVTNIGERAFQDCSGLTEIVIPDSVTSIGNFAFSGCSSLTSVTIGNGVTSIGVYAFSDCTALTQINYNAADVADLTYSSRVFYNAGKKSSGITVLFGESVKSIPAYLFCASTYDRPIITSVTIGINVTSIGEGAFYNCSGLTKIVIPDSVTSIGEEAFYGCSSLTSVTIGSGVTNIGERAFQDCSGLTEIVIPDSVTSIGNFAFSGCSSLTSVTFANPNGWWYSSSSSATSGTSISSADLASASTAAWYLRNAYYKYYWRRTA